jgi:NADPH:quinone reductase-like Zn-dependent oxidoreductase
VVATASRPETREWVRELGAHHVIDHTEPMPAQLRGLGIDEVDYVASLTHTDKHLVEIAEMLAPGQAGIDR